MISVEKKCRNCNSDFQCLQSNMVGGIGIHLIMFSPSETLFFNTEINRHVSAVLI